MNVDDLEVSGELRPQNPGFDINIFTDLGTEVKCPVITSCFLMFLHQINKTNYTVLYYTVPLRSCLDLKTPVGRTIVFPRDIADITQETRASLLSNWMEGHSTCTFREASTLAR